MASLAKRRLDLLLLVLLCSPQVGCGRIGFDLLGPLGAAGSNGSGGTTADGGGNGGTRLDAGTGGAAGAGGAREAGLEASTHDAASGGGRSARDSGPTSVSDSGPSDAGGPLVDAADAPVCVAPSVAPDYCVSVPRLPLQPVIDGELDCGVALRPLTPLGWNAAPPIPADSSMSYAVGYRPDGLYLFVEVRDTTRVPAKIGDESWRGDGVEFYVDADGVFTAPPAFDNPGTRQIQVAAPADAVTPSTRGELYTWGFDGTREPWTSNFVVVPTATGYAVEAFVTHVELAIPTWILTPGATIGFDLGLNVSDPDTATYEAADGYRLGQYFLNVVAPAGTPPFFDVGAFCLPILAP